VGEGIGGDMNDDLKGLVDIGKLSEPVVKIIEAARDAIATLYQPSGIVRGAKAEAKALLVHTQADEEMKDIRMRAQASRDLELLRYQKKGPNRGPETESFRITRTCS
jgi:hypothetical protein